MGCERVDVDDIYLGRRGDGHEHGDDGAPPHSEAIAHTLQQVAHDAHGAQPRVLVRRPQQRLHRHEYRQLQRRHAWLQSQALGGGDGARDGAVQRLHGRASHGGRTVSHALVHYVRLQLRP